MKKPNDQQQLTVNRQPIRQDYPSEPWCVAVLIALFSVWWLILAIAPWHRQDWLLENVLVLIAIAALAASYTKFQFSTLSYLLLFIFLSLHILGAHYTYAEVPYDQWLQRLMGWSLHKPFHGNVIILIACYIFYIDCC